MSNLTSIVLHLCSPLYSMRHCSLGCRVRRCPSVAAVAKRVRFVLVVARFDSTVAMIHYRQCSVICSHDLPLYSDCSTGARVYCALCPTFADRVTFVDHARRSTSVMNMANTMRLALCGKAHKRICAAVADMSGNSFHIDLKEEGGQQEASQKNHRLRKRQEVGAFQNLPMVVPSNDILLSAIRKAKMVGPTKGIANIAKRERNRGAKQLDALMKELAVPLRSYVDKFPWNQDLHPYEQCLIEFTLGKGKYEEVLGRVDVLRKKIVCVGKEHASLCAKSTSKHEAEQQLNEGFRKLEDLLRQNGKAIDDLLNIAKILRAMPVVHPETPTLCLVGAPNVGKSSLVRVLSSGKPEVCNYPFTTRGILMGHITIDYERFQVTDTPGLLRRHDDDRNNMEKLTLAALSHLPSAIMFVHDLSGDCGASASDQFFIYKEIKERFGDQLWLDVVSKADLLPNPPMASSAEDEEIRYKASGPEGTLCVSLKTNQGVDELKQRVHDILACQLSKTLSQETIS